MAKVGPLLRVSQTAVQGQLGSSKLSSSKLIQLLAQFSFLQL